MKKLICLLTALVMILALAACGRTAAPAESESPVPQNSESPVPSEAPDAPTDDTPSVLVAYFSWSGSTETLAGYIAEGTGAELFEITPAAAYTDNYNELLDVARAEQDDDARPELAETVENFADYDVVFLGYPNWWGDAPMIIRSFLDAHDFEGKTLIPFCTSGSGGFGRSLAALESGAPDAEILDGFHVTGSRVASAESDVTEWLAGLGY